MKMTPVVSSMVHSVGYDEDTMEMQIKFKNGKTYAYDNVDPDDADELINASSVGTAMQSFKSKYDGRVK